MSSFLKKEAQCACKNKLVFSVRLWYLHLSRGNINKNDVFTDVKIKQYYKNNLGSHSNPIMK